jgi:signal transduction histidine kinase
MAMTAGETRANTQDPGKHHAANAVSPTPGDRGVLSRVLGNLLDNAARHGRSRVELVLRPDSGHARVFVGDDGRGIPAPDRMRVFDRFIRRDTDPARSGGGTGLYLAIVVESPCRPWR